jgi:phospholipid transport system substrate-binding protein
MTTATIASLWTRAFAAPYRTARRGLGLPAIALTVTIGFMLHAPAALAEADVARAQSFVSDGISKAFEILRSRELSEDQQVERLHALLRSNFDVKSIGLFSLGPYSRSLTPIQRTAYLAALEDFAVNAYVRRLVTFAPTFANGPGNLLKVTGAFGTGRDDVIVTSEIERKADTPIPVQWRVRQRNEKLFVIDVIILGVSQALTYKDVFTSFLQRNNNDIDRLIDALRSKSDFLVK